MLADWFFALAVNFGMGALFWLLCVSSADIWAETDAPSETPAIWDEDHPVILALLYGAHL